MLCASSQPCWESGCRMRLLVMTEGKPFGAKDAASTNFIYGDNLQAIVIATVGSPSIHVLLESITQYEKDILDNFGK